MTLFSFEEAWLLAIFEAILPSGAHPSLPSGAREAPMLPFVRDLMATAPLETALGVRAALWAVTLSPIVMLGRARLFGSLSPAVGAAVLERLGQSHFYPIREMPVLLKLVACMGWAALPEVRDRLGVRYDDRRAPAWAGLEGGER